MSESLAGARRTPANLTARQARGAEAWARMYLLRVGLADASGALAAGMAALGARFGGAPDGSAYLWIGLALPAAWVAVLHIAGAYDSRLIGAGADEFRRVISAGMGMTAAIAIAAYTSRTEIARGFVIIALPAATLLTLLARFGLRKRLHCLRTRGECMRRLVAVGYPGPIADLKKALTRETHHGLKVVAACVIGPDRPSSIEGVTITGGPADIIDTVRRCDADIVAVLACREMIGDQLRDLAWALEKTGTDLCVAPALLDVAGPRTTIRPTAGLPLLHLDHPEFTGPRCLIKSVFDKTVAITALIILIPVLAAIAIAIRLDDGGPALFRQTRVGKNGRHFTVYKFRTMTTDAEQRKSQLQVMNNGSGALFKIRDDPRITGVGSYLRRHSLDELPQLINILTGDMSLVGPRPALPQEMTAYPTHMHRRLAVKPGITGLWQVSGRSDLPWDEAVRLDLRYVENWSLTLDIQVIWKTLPAIAHGHGAY